MKIESSVDLAPTYNEPQPDWVPIDRAMYFCSSSTFDTSAEKCKDALVGLVQEIFSTGRITHDEYGVGIEADGITTWIQLRGTIEVLPSNLFDNSREEPDWDVIIRGTRGMAQSLEPQEWDRRLPPKDRIAAEWHRFLLTVLYHAWRHHFLNAIRSGAARIMARTSILAPFKMIAWDQWQFFRLLDPIEQKLDYWDVHQPSDAVNLQPATAISPSGERLFSIYVAPGQPIRQGSEPPDQEMKCQQWLVELMREFPQRSPKPLKQLGEEAVAKFPGLSERGFIFRCFPRAQEQAGNKNWSRRGAPKKFQQ